MGSTPTRSRHGGAIPCSEDCGRCGHRGRATRPPRVRPADRPRLRAGDRRHRARPRAVRRTPSSDAGPAVTALARAVVAERDRLLADARPAPPPDELAAEVGAAPRRDGRCRRPAGDQRDGSSSIPTWAARPGRRRHRGGRRPRPRGYLLLELDRATGRRGARARVAEDHLVALTGAEDALVTNNNAAAVALAVGLAGRGGGVVVSRGELVEIGGGVRIPEIIRRAGARLIEVGTTNRTRPADFEDALADGRARVVLRVHPSNFTMAGFTEAPDPAAVAEARPRAMGPSSSTTSAAARCSTPPRSGWPTSRCPASAWRPAPTSSRSAATSSSAGRRPGSSSAARTSSRASGAIRWPARCARTRSRIAALAATLGLYRAGRATTRDPDLADARRAGRRPRGAGGGARGAPRVDGGDASSRCARRSAAGRCPARPCHRSASRSPAPVGDAAPGALREGDPIVIGRIEDGRGRARPAHDRAGPGRRGLGRGGRAGPRIAR